MFSLKWVVNDYDIKYTYKIKYRYKPSYASLQNDKEKMTKVSVKLWVNIIYTYIYIYIHKRNRYYTCFHSNGMWQLLFKIFIY